MPEKTPISVFLAPDVRIAGMFVEWLLEKGIGAEIKADTPQPTVDPLTGAATMADPTGIEVVVTDPDKVDEAKQIIADRVEDIRALREKRDARAARTGAVTAACEECGRSSEWAAADMGTTQDCPFCGNYMDIPDPDDNWDGIDFGTEDEPEGTSEPKS